MPLTRIIWLFRSGGEVFSRSRFCVDTFAAVTSVALLVITLVEPHWFELLFELSPDDGDGSLEALIAILMLGVASAFFLHRARRSWKRRADMTARQA